MKKSRIKTIIIAVSVIAFFAYLVLVIGINLKYLYPFVGAMLATGVTGMISRLIGVIANSVGVGGLPAFLSMKAQYMLPYIGVMALCIVLSILFTLLLSKTSLNSENRKKN